MNYYTLALAGSLMLNLHVKAEEERLANIVLIYTDDLGYGDVSFLNPNSKVQTPHMDALAKAGVWSSDGHAASTVCSPSRYSILTGRYAWRERRVRSARLNPWDESVITERLETLPRMLKKEGYHTACIGKWHLGFEWPWKDGVKPDKSVIGSGTSTATVDMFDWSKPIKGGPLAAGFDYYFGDDVPNMPPYAFIENQKLTCDPVNISGRDLMKQQVMRGGYIHGVGPGEEGWKLERVMPTITTKACEYIKKSKDKPFFLMFNTTTPHTPFVPLKEFQGTTKAGTYGDLIAQTDDSIGQIIAAIKAAGIEENTIVIVSSDNGPAPFVRETIRTHQHDPSGDLRGLKRDLLEGGHRVPFIFYWPAGGLSGGREIKSVISQVDIFATVAGITGVTLSDGVAEDSLDMLPTLKNDTPVRSELVYHSAKGKLGLRQGNWVYLREGGITKEPVWYSEMRKSDISNVPHLLFDLSRDLKQQTTLHQLAKERVVSMEARLVEIEKSKQTK